MQRLRAASKNARGGLNLLASCKTLEVAGRHAHASDAEDMLEELLPRPYFNAAISLKSSASRIFMPRGRGPRARQRSSSDSAWAGLSLRPSISSAKQGSTLLLRCTGGESSRRLLPPPTLTLQMNYARVLYKDPGATLGDLPRGHGHDREGGTDSTARAR